jgi:catechol 2,3-dioxygenase-like lactoylglutathione lyase family enzyme
VALEVGDLEAALEFYGSIFALRGVDREPGLVFLDLGDQFVALNEGRRQPADDARHFGLVLDDKPALREALSAQGIAVLPGPRLDFRDPWGNRIQIVDYRDIQFTKAPEVLNGMDPARLGKSERALGELRAKGLAGAPRT